MRLRTRFAVALLAMVVVLSVTVLVGFSLYRDAVVDGQRDDVARTSDAVATQLEVVLDEKREIARLWARELRVHANSTGARQRALETFVAGTTFSGASVVLANGTMTAFYSEGIPLSQQEQLVGQSFADRRYVQRALAGETYVSDPVAAESGNRIVTVSTPIRDDGEIVGTFNAAFHLRDGGLGQVIETNAGEMRGVQIRANGSVVYSVGPSSSGDDVLVANATVDETGWTVSATEQRAAFESRLSTITALQGGAALLVLLSVGVFGAWLYRTYVGNFERMHDGFASLVAGEYGATVDLSGSTEWEEVEDHFNELSETLARRRSEVLVLNRVLRHNLRNAMTVVVGNADRIVDHARDETTVTEARRIRQRGESLLELAEHARMVESSLDGPTEDAEPRLLAHVLDQVVATLADEYPRADIRGPADPPTVSIAGGDLLVVALDELVRNAVVHADAASPTVEVTATADADEVTITVSDDGPGIPDVERRVLTDPFAETPTEHGRGLGLWLVKWLVQWLDGDVEVTVDDGTTVVVTVPRAAEEF